MRFATLRTETGEQAAVLVDDDRWVPVNLVESALAGDLLVLIQQLWSDERLRSLRDSASRVPERHTIPILNARYAPPYRNPPKVIGVGLNYAAHAGELGEIAPEEPASFIKCAQTIIGPEDPIQLPAGRRVTAEAELGIIMGRSGADQPDEANALSAVFGFCAILDQTALDVLERNPRFLTRSKNFPSFLSFGPEVVTADEFLHSRSLADIRVTTSVDGSTASNLVAAMTHPPARLISFFGSALPWLPGDILSTGTPGALAVHEGAVASARLDGLMELRNPVQMAGAG